MKRLSIRDWRLVLVLLVVAVVAAPLGAAGQCQGDANGNGFVNFADYGAVAMNFGNSCEPLARFVDNGDGTITDHENPRMWAKRSDDGGFHDKDKLYTWGSRNSPYPPNGTALTEYLAGLNGSGSGYCFAGYCDWRLPTTEELTQIVDPQEVGDKVFAIFKSPCSEGCSLPSCSCNPLLYIWTANTSPLAPSQAMALSSANGDFDRYGKQDYEFGVRAVRTIASTP